MILLLSSKFQKQVSLFILLVFYSSLVMAGRESFFTGLEKSPVGFFNYGPVVNKRIMDKAGKAEKQPVAEVMATRPEKAESANAETGKVHEIEKAKNKAEKKQDDIGGPGQPEMTAFKSVGADNMVDLFTGDFSYNIPLGDVGGYPINIFYNGGISMDQEASWVGLGWNINPGTIVRNKRGIPDDFDGTEKLTKEMNIKPQITVGVSGGNIKELFGFPINKGNFLNNSTVGIFYNNYRGVGLEFGKKINVTNILIKNADQKTMFTDDGKFSTSVSGGPSTIGATLSFNINSQSGLNINPSLNAVINSEFSKNNAQYGTALGLSANFNSRIGLSSMALSAEVNKTQHNIYALTVGKGPELHDIVSTAPSFYSASVLTFGIPSITPSINIPLTHRNFNLGIAFGSEKKFGIFKGTRLGGYYSEARLADKDKIQEKPAYGYLYFQDANGDKDAMLDFNRLNDVAYTKSNPVIDMPVYTYDVFAINGQGIGGGFRAYRGDIGSVHDNYVKTKESAASIDGELGVGSVAEFGLNLHYVNTPTTAGEWQAGNIARDGLKFSRSHDVHQAAYFKNPAEAAKINEAFLNNLGNDELVRIKLDDAASTRIPLAVPKWETFSNGQTKTGEKSFANNETEKPTRDKRTQVISYLTAEEAASVGMDKKIYYFAENDFPKGECRASQGKSMKRVDPVDPVNPGAQIRKPNHLSEITVTQTDGKRYVYGIPVYNLAEEEVSFNVSNMGKTGGEQNSVDRDKQLVTYNENDLRNNSRGRDWFYQKDKVPAYAHSFLLTGLISPDYVDVTGDGITDDDLGSAVKFNYTKIENSGNGGFGWRAPFTGTSGQAAFNDGLKTDKADDKGHYTYGERELWYLNSIESKNMIATFTISTQRNDGRAVVNALGGRSTAGMRKLEKIDIYSKAEWIKTTGTPKPVKTIHFEYYDQLNELCHGTPDNAVTGGGKLTLKRIWFTYNGNEKLKKNYFVFKYTNNKPYDRTANDRWGTYKPAADNSLEGFSTLSNADYPFSIQDKQKGDQNASAWMLNEITLPSGAKIKVDFESDDYAYVQDRRAAQMFHIAGFGKTAGATPENHLYNSGFYLSADNQYIFIDAPAANKNEVFTKYLQGLNQLFMKLWVRMPHDQYNDNALGDYEAIPVYALIEDYGVVNANRFWIKVKADRGGYSPMFYNAMQFMIKNLASKAYPGSDVKGNSVLGIFKALGGMLYNLADILGGYYQKARLTGTCREAELTKSYIRLDNPNFKKLGGGYRVKKVTIKDSWKEMTAKQPGSADGMPESEYGQEYDYTTTAQVNGQETTISSGVAAYEPAVGAEENPFREILRYDDRQPLGPNERGAIELPLGEMFYPAPAVGYSKVTVRSIHRDNVKSGVGRTVTEFYTSKDFPTISDRIDLDGNSHYRFKSNPILRLLKLDVREMVTLSQGFRVQTNDMNGKMHKQISYDETGKQLMYSENIYRIVKTGENKYVFGNMVPMMINAKEKVENHLMGKEIEVMTDFREHISKAVTFNMDFNINVNILGGFPVPVPSIIPPVHFAMTGYRSASVLKVVNTFGILEKVKHIDKGSEVNTRDLAYDAETGSVLVTETNNEFNKPVYSFSYPAHWAYTGMQGAYKNIDAVYEHLRFQNGKLTTPGFDMGVFESGDELYVSDLSTFGALEEPACGTPGTLSHIPKPADPENPSLFVRKIWVLDMGKDPANTQRKFLFIDKNGDPYSGGDVSIRIIRSGKRNLLEASVGSFASLANPLRLVGNDLKLVVDDETKIINTTAGTFKETWRVDEAFFAKDSIVKGNRVVPIRKIQLFPVKNYNLYYNEKTGPFGPSNNYIHSPNSANTNSFYSFLNTPRSGGGGSGYPETETKTTNNWLLYNFQALPANVQVLSSKLTLLTHSSRLGSCNNSTDAYAIHPADLPQRASPLTSNNIEIRRMKSQWLGDNDQQGWTQLFVNDNKVDMNTLSLIPSVGNSNTDFKADYNNGQIVSDTRIDVTTIIKAMVSDIRDHGLDYAYGLRLQMNKVRNANNLMRQQCFSTLSSSCANSFLEVYYYNCADQETGDLGNGLYDCGGFAYQTTFCLSHFTQKRINPYTKGVLGNWRPDLSYVYYDNRRESNASVPAEDLSKGGLIATGYKSFWISTASNITDLSIEVNADAITGSGGNPALWKWNSKITQINNKGFELENTDPLGRFNCGLYGYDKSLPVAVANNAKLRNTAYDGFEDYTYEANKCAPFCKPQRHLIIDNATSHISTEASHSGISSLKLGPGESVSAHAPVTTVTADESGYGIRIQNSITSATGTWVSPQGNGLTAKYFNNSNPISQFTPGNIESWLNTLYQNPQVRTDANVNMNRYNTSIYASGPPPTGIVPAFYVRWDGYIQSPIAASATNPIQLAFSSDDGMKIWIDDVLLTGPGFDDLFSNHSVRTAVKAFTGWSLGSVHKIRIYFFDKGGDATANVSWNVPGFTNGFEVVPKDFYYLQQADANGTVVTGTLSCEKPDIIQVKDNAITDVFSPLQGQKMLFSAWVKEGITPCNCDNYSNNQVQVLFNNSTTVSATLTPAGKIIEGWQRYEAVFDIPASATAIEVKLRNTGSGNVYFDDLRLHPYNANMKSFVYHPVTLRLMAELDENNYTSFYEYDDDGTLTRVKKETERGIKTITETRSALQKKITE